MLWEWLSWFIIQQQVSHATFPSWYLIVAKIIYIRWWQILQATLNHMYNGVQGIIAFLVSQWKKIKVCPLWKPLETSKIGILPWNFHHEHKIKLLVCLPNFKANKINQTLVISIQLRIFGRFWKMQYNMVQYALKIQGIEE